MDRSIASANVWIWIIVCFHAQKSQNFKDLLPGEDSICLILFCPIEKDHELHHHRLIDVADGVHLAIFVRHCRHYFVNVYLRNAVFVRIERGVLMC